MSVCAELWVPWPGCLAALSAVADPGLFAHGYIFAAYFAVVALFCDGWALLPTAIVVVVVNKIDPSTHGATVSSEESGSGLLVAAIASTVGGAAAIRVTRLLRRLAATPENDSGRSAARG